MLRARQAAAQLSGLLLRQGACSLQHQQSLTRHGPSNALADSCSSSAASSSNGPSTSTSSSIGGRIVRRFASSLSNVIAAEAGKTRIQGYFPGGFIINQTQVEGALLCLPDTWVMWDVTSLADVTTDSLAILDVAAPAPEVLVMGCGSTMQRLPADVMDFLAARGIAVELIDTRNAIATFNFLNDEGRVVVGAMLPMGESSNGNGNNGLDSEGGSNHP